MPLQECSLEILETEVEMFWAVRPQDLHLQRLKCYAKHLRRPWLVEVSTSCTVTDCLTCTVLGKCPARPASPADARS